MINGKQFRKMFVGEFKISTASVLEGIASDRVNVEMPRESREFLKSVTSKIEKLEREVQALTDLYKTASEEQDRLLLIEKQLEQDKAKLMELIKDYALISIDNKRLVREIDVLLNGDDGAAKQASLCDIVAQLNSQKLAKNTPTTDKEEP